MIKEAEDNAEEDKKVKERVDAKNSFDNYMGSMKATVEGSGDNKGLSEKLDDDEKSTINDAIKGAEEWMSSNPDADAEEIKEKHKEVESVCAPIISKHYQGGSGDQGDNGGDDEDDEAHDEL